MAGEMLADGQSPMMMTVDQYNERVARTWALAIETERERIIKLLESDPKDIIASGGGLRAGYETAIALIKGEK